MLAVSTVVGTRTPVVSSLRHDRILQLPNSYSKEKYSNEQKGEEEKKKSMKLP